MSMLASLTEICCHTCRFNPEERADTMAQILSPCTLSFSVSDQNTGVGGMRVNVNISDMVLNVSPYSLDIVTKSVQTFLGSFAQGETQGEETISAEKSASLIFQVLYYFLATQVLAILNLMTTCLEAIRA